MNLPPYAKLASRLLARGEPFDTPPPSEEARHAAIGAIEAALIAKRRRERVLRGGAVASVLAAAAAVLLLLPHRARAPGAERSLPLAATKVAVVALPIGAGARTAEGRALRPDGETLLPGNHVRALPRGQALLHFATGSRVMLDEDSEVELVQAADSQIIALQHGALRADVAKLGGANHFVVRTGDAEVEVHGTSFRVAAVAADAACGSGTTTRVEVYEGVVSVRARGEEARVAAGDVWPHGCETTGGVPASVARDLVPAPVEPASGKQSPAQTGSPRPSRAAALPLPTPSELRAQNDMFIEAATARRAGDAQGAIAKLELLLARYPRGPLAEDAAAQCMKLLRDVDHARAVRAARSYLAQHPNGFARPEAEAILGAGG